jgi:hypothetical protein
MASKGLWVQVTRRSDVTGLGGVFSLVGLRLAELELPKLLATLDQTSSSTRVDTDADGEQ